MDARERTDPSQLFLGDTEAAPLRRCSTSGMCVFKESSSSSSSFQKQWDCYNLSVISRLQGR
jgi:hypothetical protein